MKRFAAPRPRVPWEPVGGRCCRARGNIPTAPADITGAKSAPPPSEGMMKEIDAIRRSVARGDGSDPAPTQEAVFSAWGACTPCSPMTWT